MLETEKKEFELHLTKKIVGMCYAEVKKTGNLLESWEMPMYLTIALMNSAYTITYLETEAKRDSINEMLKQLIDSNEFSDIDLKEKILDKKHE